MSALSARVRVEHSILLTKRGESLVLLQFGLEQETELPKDVIFSVLFCHYSELCVFIFFIKLAKERTFLVRSSYRHLDFFFLIHLYLHKHNKTNNMHKFVYHQAATRFGLHVRSSSGSTSCFINTSYICVWVVCYWSCESIQY